MSDTTDTDVIRPGLVTLGGETIELAPIDAFRALDLLTQASDPAALVRARGAVALYLGWPVGRTWPTSPRPMLTLRTDVDALGEGIFNALSDRFGPLDTLRACLSAGLWAGQAFVTAPEVADAQAFSGARAPAQGSGPSSP